MATPNPITMSRHERIVTSSKVSSPIVARRGREPNQGIGALLRVWWRTLVTRQDLVEIDDRMLADLGISRAQAAFELSRAPWSICKRTAASKPGHE